MLICILFYCASHFIVAYCCDLRKIMVTNQVNVEIEGEGFHRVVNANFDLGSMKRLVDCSVSLGFVIPAGSYVDFLENNYFQTGEFCVMALKPFDIEKTTEESNEQVIYVSMKRKLLNSFRFSEKISFPLQMRYHSAKTSNTSVGVKFRTPILLLNCRDSLYQTELENCKRFVVSAPCDCVDKIEKNSQIKLCSYVQLNSGNSRNISDIYVPVGNLNHAPIVVIVTAVCVFVCILFTVYFTLCANDKVKTL